MSLDLFSNDITSCESFPDNVKSLLPNVQSFCEDELEGLSSSGGEDELADGDEDEYEDDEEDEGDESEGDGLEGQREGGDDHHHSQQAAMSSSGGKSGPSSIPINTKDVKDTNGIKLLTHFAVSKFKPASNFSDIAAASSHTKVIRGVKFEL